jgi:hypothetical protein
VLTGLTGLNDGVTERRPVEYTRREIVLRLTAGLALICGLIHIGAGVDHYQEYALYTAVFSLLALAQITWAALLVWPEACLAETWLRTAARHRRAVDPLAHLGRADRAAAVGA